MRYILTNVGSFATGRDNNFHNSEWRHSVGESRGRPVCVCGGWHLGLPNFPSFDRQGRRAAEVVFPELRRRMAYPSIANSDICNLRAATHPDFILSSGCGYPVLFNTVDLCNFIRPIAFGCSQGGLWNFRID